MLWKTIASPWPAEAARFNPVASLALLLYSIKADSVVLISSQRIHRVPFGHLKWEVLLFGVSTCLQRLFFASICFFLKWPMLLHSGKEMYF